MAMMSSETEFVKLQERQRKFMELIDRFIDRKTSPEEEASLPQIFSGNHLEAARHKRSARDLEKAFAQMDEFIPGALNLLANNDIDALQRLTIGIAALLELTHLESRARRLQADKQA